MLVQVPQFEIPEITNETTIDDLITQATARILGFLGLDSLPEEAKEDGNDIIKDLIFELSRCRDDLAETKSMKEFRKCIRANVDDARDKIFELENELEDSTAGSPTLRPILILFALLAVIHNRQWLSHALIVSTSQK